MAKKIIDTNPYLRTQKDRIDRITRSASAPAWMHGTKINPEEIRRMASRAVKQYSARKK